MKHLTTITLTIAILALLADCNGTDLFVFFSFKFAAFLLVLASWKYCKAHIIEKAEKFNKWIDGIVR